MTANSHLNLPQDKGVCVGMYGLTHSVAEMWCDEKKMQLWFRESAWAVFITTQYLAPCLMKQGREEEEEEEEEEIEGVGEHSLP